MLTFKIILNIILYVSLFLQAFVATGTNLSLQFFPANLHGDQRQVPTREYVDFERETGKVGREKEITHLSLLLFSCCNMVWFAADRLVTMKIDLLFSDKMCPKLPLPPFLYC